MNKHLMLIAALSLLNGPVLAQPSSSPVEEQSVDWRKANEEVGQFKRGHADILKWEQANRASAEVKPPSAAGLPLDSAEAAVRQAWRAHPDLAPALTRFGAGNTARIASGRWLELAPSLQRRIDDADEVLEVAHATRKAWLAAVAAQQGLQHQRDVLEATEAGAELARRMARVGNWSKLQQAQEQTALADAQMQWRRAQYEAQQKRVALQKAMNLWTQSTPISLSLPGRLPGLPAEAMTEQALQARLDTVLPQLPRKERLQTQANAQLAYSAYLASYSLARSYQDEVLKLRQFIQDETVLRYNGMLMNAWELLAEARTRSLAVANAINAQRDFWFAEADLQLVLQGSAPESFVSLGDGGSEATASAGH